MMTETNRLFCKVWQVAIIFVCIVLIGLGVCFLFKKSDVSSGNNVEQSVQKNKSINAMSASHTPPKKPLHESIDSNSTNSSVAVGHPLGTELGNQIQWLDGRGEEVSKIITEKLPHAEMAESWTKNPPNDRRAAFSYLNRSINMAKWPSVAVELTDYYVFSGGTSTRNITDFSSGIAIRKSDGKVFVWQSK